MNEAHIPRRGSVMGNRKTGDLGDRVAPGNQSQAAGGRYDTKALAEEDMKTVIGKMNSKKKGKGTVVGKTPTRNVSDPIVINPEKNIQGQTPFN